MSTLILSRRDIAALMSPADYYRAVEAAFRAAKEGRASSPAPMHIDAHGGAFHAKGAAFEGTRRYAALKLNGNFPGNPARGLPTIQGAIILSDAQNGSLLAILDSIEVTLRRTAAASALAAHHLSRGDAKTLFIAGCGDQAGAHLAALLEVRRLDRVLVYDLDAAKAQAFAARMQQSFGLPVEAADLSGAKRCDMIVTCTTASKAFLDCEHVSPGAFIAAVGADNPHKSEIAPELMANASVVADVTAQCAVMGDLRAAITAGTMTADDVHADFGEIVTAAKSGRKRREEIFIFDSTGTALQDVASAAIAYERALERGAGLKIALGAS